MYALLNSKRASYSNSLSNALFLSGEQSQDELELDIGAMATKGAKKRMREDDLSNPDDSECLGENVEGEFSRTHDFYRSR